MKVVLFGTGRFASLAWHALRFDSDLQPAGFAIDAAHLDHETFHDLPVIPFEKISKRFPADRYRLLVSLGPRDGNRLRAARFETARGLGYRPVTWVSRRADHWPDLVIGDGCMVFERAIVQPFATIGDNVIVRAGANLSHHCQIGDHVYVSPGAVLAGGVTVGARATIGAGAVVRDGVRIAEDSVIGAGAVVARDTEPGRTYVGNPARASPGGTGGGARRP